MLMGAREIRQRPHIILRSQGRARGRGLRKWTGAGRKRYTIRRHSARWRNVALLCVPARGEGALIMKISLIGVPMDLGADRSGVDMGPSAIRYAGIAEKLGA